MRERIARGWSIVKASWAVLQRYPKLLLFPIVSAIALVVVIAAIGVPVYGSGYARQVIDNPRWDDPVVFAIVFASYLVGTFVIVFFNAAMSFSVRECFAGGQFTLRSGVVAAGGRLPPILAWSVVAATIGLILDMVQPMLADKLALIGELLPRLGQVVWAAMTYFVVPVIVAEGLGPVGAMKRSSSLLRRTWGEAAGGEGGLGIIFTLLCLPVLVVAAVAFGLRVDVGTALVLAAIVVPYLLALVVVFVALGAIFRSGVYRYATSGEAVRIMDSATSPERVSREGRRDRGRDPPAP